MLLQMVIKCENEKVLIVCVKESVKLTKTSHIMYSNNNKSQHNKGSKID